MRRCARSPMLWRQPMACVAATPACGRRGRCWPGVALRGWGIEPPGRPSLTDAVRLAADASAGPARRDCAVLLVHALAVPRLVPADSAEVVCALMEGALRDVLLRCGYPFGG